MDELGNFFWVDICNYIGGFIRWIVYRHLSEIGLIGFVNNKENLKWNVIVGNLVLIPLLVFLMNQWLDF